MSEPAHDHRHPKPTDSWLSGYRQRYGLEHYSGRGAGLIAATGRIEEGLCMNSRALDHINDRRFSGEGQ